MKITETERETLRSDMQALWDDLDAGTQAALVACGAESIAKQLFGRRWKQILYNDNHPNFTGGIMRRVLPYIGDTATQKQRDAILYPCDTDETTLNTALRAIAKTLVLSVKAA